MTIEGEDVKINFEGLLNYLVKEHFKLLKIENKYKKYEIRKKEKKDTSLKFCSLILILLQNSFGFYLI